MSPIESFREAMRAGRLQLGGDCGDLVWAADRLVAALGRFTGNPHS